jgi:hypothetical protein
MFFSKLSKVIDPDTDSDPDSFFKRCLNKILSPFDKGG